MGCCVCTDAEGRVARTCGWLVRGPGSGLGRVNGNRAIRNDRLCYADDVGVGHENA